MQNQRFTRTCSRHVGKFVHLCQIEVLEANLPQRTVIFIMKKICQLLLEGFLIRKPTIQVNLREKEAEILEIFPGQSASVFTDFLCISSDVFIIHSQFGFRYSASRLFEEVFNEQGITSRFIDTFFFRLVHLSRQLLHIRDTQLSLHEFEEHQFFIKAQFLHLILFSPSHNYISSNIRLLNSCSVRTTFHDSSDVRRFSRLLSPFT